MTKNVTEANDIWVLKPTEDDLLAGAKYAAITLPWTFNRMMMNTGSSGQKFRALNIAKGIVGQEILRRELELRGIFPVLQEKSHRDEDLFDFNIILNEKEHKLDIKSINYYSDYRIEGREPLSTELVIQNSGYPGPDWRRFFPMLVPHTQITQKKEAYCFIIASSIDTRNDVATDRIGYALTAFPYGEPMSFLCSKRLCLSRENAQKGIYLNIEYRSGALLDESGFTLNIIGEWAGKLQPIEVALGKNKTSKNVGPFSCVSSFQLNIEDYNRMYGTVYISIGRNEYTDIILNSLRRDINSVPSTPLEISRGDFCNLILPNDYEVFIVGYIPKPEFLGACRKYTGWVWPLDSENKFNNQPWSQITAKDLSMLTKTGFVDTIQKDPSLLKSGFMKTTGRGGGACCYVFPNIGRGGGVKETNLYVLPQDLYAMSELS
ncbi:hypothetical protein ACFLUO_07300 [Chloroflexota bacterium]